VREEATLSGQLRRSIRRCGTSRYRLCKEIGLSESAMSKFMAGKVGLSMDVLDRLFPLLGLRLVGKQRARRPKTRHAERGR